jgi:hypothetical protein
MAGEPASIKDRQLTAIVGRIHKGLCVPFLGAGVNVSGGDYVGLPLGREVALLLARDLVEMAEGEFDSLAKVDVINEALKEYPGLLRMELENLARVALYLERTVDSAHLMSVIREVLPDEQRVPSELLCTLAELPFKVIVTTNYDRLMERALEAVDRDFHVVVQPLTSVEPDDLSRLDDELAELKAEGTLILYKIHGSFRDEADDNGADSKRIVLTEEDYIEFLAHAASGIPRAILTELKDSTLLFLGYGLEDWDFRTIFKGTVETLERHETLRSYAIQRNPPDFWVDFWRDKKIDIFDMDLYDFARRLRKRYDRFVAEL